jgi:hypothetical protein
LSHGMGHALVHVVQPRRLAPSAVIWIARGQGATCDRCGKAIPADEPQYDVITDGVEMHLDRDCFQRRMEQLE